MVTPVIVGTDIKWIQATNTRMVCLSANVSSASGILSYNEGSSNYEIPVGRQFTIVRVFLENSETTTNSSLEMYYGATPDTTAGATIFAKFRTSGTGGGINFEMGAPTISAGNYVSCRNNSAGNIYTTLIGVECDA